MDIRNICLKLRCFVILAYKLLHRFAGIQVVGYIDNLKFVRMSYILCILIDKKSSSTGKYNYPNRMDFSVSYEDKGSDSD